MDDLISRQAVEEIINDIRDCISVEGYWAILERLKKLPPVNPQEPKTGWNNHQIACMIADLFGDACACNYNGIDEWLGELCDFKDTCCPNPVGVACWEQFLKYSQSRYTECGYEVRNKNALQEPKTGHWNTTDYFIFKCSECECEERTDTRFCPNCGAKMEGKA